MFNAGEIEYIGQVISLAIADGIKAGMLAVEAERQTLQATNLEPAFSASRAERIENAARRVIELKRIRTLGGFGARGVDIWGAIDDLARTLESM